MSFNSDNRKKTLIVSVLAFLLVGGSVFLFFVVQGSNELTGKGKNSRFSYGTAAREGVSSFFRSVGFLPQEEEKLSDAAVARLEERGLPLAELGVASSNPDMSEWMKNAGGAAAAGRPSSPTNVPKMAAGSPGTFAGGGGSKSAGSVTRFGGESASGVTSVNSRAQAGAAGVTDKGTMGTLKNAKALLGEGLRSNSAMTAQSKWNQSFGVGGASGGRSSDLAYNKTGLVNLDKIKSGEIADLKMDKASSLKTTDVTSPVKDDEGTKKALAGDADVKKAAEDKMKQDIAKQAISAAGDAATKSATQDNKGGAAADPNKPPEEVMKAAMEASCAQGCTTEDGATYKDSVRVFEKNPDGTWNCTIRGEQVNADGTKIEYRDTITYDASGMPLDLSVVEKPA